MKPQRQRRHAGVKGAQGRVAVRRRFGCRKRDMFGPLLPPRYRLDGPGALPDAAEQFSAQLAASPRAPTEPADLETLRGFGLAQAADIVSRSALVDADATWRRPRRPSSWKNAITFR